MWWTNSHTLSKLESLPCWAARSVPRKLELLHHKLSCDPKQRKFVYVLSHNQVPNSHGNHLNTLWALVRCPQYTHASFLHIQTNLDILLSLILFKSMTTLLPPNLSYLVDFSVSEEGSKALNIAHDPSSTQIHFWLFISLIDCIGELQHQAHHI